MMARWLRALSVAFCLPPSTQGHSPSIIVCQASSSTYHNEEEEEEGGEAPSPPTTYPPPPPPASKRPLRKALSPSAINSLLVKSSDDLECLLGVIDMHLSSFNAVNCATALDRLSRMAVQERKEKLVREDPIFPHLLDHTGSTCHALSTPALVSLLKNLARLRASDTSLVPGLEAALEQRCEALSPQELVGVITGLAAMREPPSSHLLGQLEARLESLSGGDLASAVEAIARMRSRPSWAMASLKTASEKSALEAGSSQDSTDLSRTIKGLTQMKHRPPPVVLKAFEEGMRADLLEGGGLQTMEPGEMAATLVSMATLRYPLAEEALDGLQEGALATLGDLSLLEIANLLQALSYYRHGRLASPVLGDVCHAMEEKLIGASPEALKTSVTALAQACHDDDSKPSPRFWQRFTSVMSTQLDNFSCSQLTRTMSGLVWALGTGSGHEAMWEGLMKALQEVLPDADPAEVTTLAGLVVDLLESGAFKHCPTGFITAYNARLRLVVARLPPAALVTVTQLLAMSATTLPRGLMGSIANRMRDLLPEFLDLPDELAQIILHLTQVGRTNPEQAVLRCLVDGLLAHATHLPALSLVRVLEALALHQMQPGSEVWEVLDGRAEKDDLLPRLTFPQRVHLLWCLVVLDDPSVWPYSLPQELLSSISQGLEDAGSAEELIKDGSRMDPVKIQQLLLASRYRLVPMNLGPWITRLGSLVLESSQPQVPPSSSSSSSTSSSLSSPQQSIRRAIKATFESLELPCAVENDPRYPGWYLTVRVGRDRDELVALVVHGQEPVGLTSLTARLLKRWQGKGMDRPVAVVAMSVAQWRAAVNKGVTQFFLLQKLSSEDIELPSWCERLVIEPNARIVRQQQYGGALAPAPKNRNSSIEISWKL